MNKKKSLLVLSFLLALVAIAGRTAFSVAQHRIFYVASGSMEKTLRVDDRILVDTRTYVARAPKRGEVTIFQPPDAALLNSGAAPKDVNFVMRVVGVPGETIEIRNRQLFVNNKPIAEPYAFWDGNESYDLKIVQGAVYSRDYMSEGSKGVWRRNMIPVSDAEEAKIEKAKPGKVPTNCFLILGDHRTNANDSHVWGFADRSAFRGQVVNVFWPISHRKSLR